MVVVVLWSVAVTVMDDNFPQCCYEVSYSLRLSLFEF